MVGHISLGQQLDTSRTMEIGTCTFIADNGVDLVIIDQNQVPQKLGGLISLYTPVFNNESSFEMRVFQLGRANKATINCRMKIVNTV